jgi:hypothetical protein
MTILDSTPEYNALNDFILRPLMNTTFNRTSFADLRTAPLSSEPLLRYVFTVSSGYTEKVLIPAETDPAMATEKSPDIYEYFNAMSDFIYARQFS